MLLCTEKSIYNGWSYADDFQNPFHSIAMFLSLWSLLDLTKELEYLL